MPGLSIKKETLAHVFSCEFCGISKNTFFTENLWTTASKFSVIWFKENKQNQIQRIGRGGHSLHKRVMIAMLCSRKKILENFSHTRSPRFSPNLKYCC